MENLLKLQQQYIDGNLNGWWRDSNSINILITGKTGTGKSSLVNAILGQDVAAVGHNLDPETSKVSSFSRVIEGINVTVWDSPGLQDGLSKEADYLNDIEACCKEKIDLFIYCVSMDNLRFTEGNRDLDAMRKLTAKLGKKIWSNAVFILTRANLFITGKRSILCDTDDINEQIRKIFEEKLEEWKTEIKECLLEKINIPAEIVENMPILPAGMKGLPMLVKGYPNTIWLSKIWLGSLLVTKHHAQPALIKMNMSRLTKASDIHTAEEFHELLQKEKIIIEDSAIRIGREVHAEQAGRRVGRVSGEKACMAHLIEKIFSNIPDVKVLDTTIVIDEEFSFAAAIVLLGLGHDD